MKNTEEQIKTIKLKLVSLYHKEGLIRITIGINIVIAVVFVLNTLLSLFEMSGLNSVVERTILFYAGAVISIISVAWFILLPLLNVFNLFKKINYLELAEKVGMFYPEVKGGLKNALELKENSNKSQSETLKNAAIKNVFEKVENLNFNKTVSFTKTKTAFATSSIVLIITGIIFYSAPGLRLASYRIMNYFNEFSKPPRFVYYISPGNASVTRNSEIIINAETIGEIPKAVNFYIKSKNDPEYIKYKTFSDSSGKFTHRLKPLKNSTRYYVEAENIVSEMFLINVIDKPLISQLQLIITPPSYTKRSKVVQRDNGNIKNIVGSKVSIELKSNKKLLSGYLDFSNNLKKELNINGSLGNTSFYIKENLEYKIMIFDSTKNSNKNPVTYTISALVDEYPVLEVASPPTKTRLTRLENIATQLRISDDYGLNKLLLYHRLSLSSFEKPEEKYSTAEINIDKTLKNQEVFWTWDVSDLFLTAGDEVTFFFEVFDNDKIAGPKSTRSGLYTLYVPTIEELYQESDVAQEEALKEIEQTLKETEKFKEELEKLGKELKLNKKEISWEERKKIENARRKFEDLKNKIEDTQKKLSQNQNKLDQNELLSKETLEKYFELQSLMNEMNNDEMKAAMQKLQQQLETMNRENANKSLDEMQFNEEMFRKSLERTMNLLKRIQIEQKMDEIVKRINTIKESLDKLEKETKSKPLQDNTNKETLAKKQDEITQKITNLTQELKKLQEKMENIGDMPNNEMDEFREKFESQKNQQLSEKAKENLLNQLASNAQQQMQSLSQNMNEAAEQMQNMQQQMQMNNQLQTIYDMMKATNNLINLSKREEDLTKKTEKTGGAQLEKSAQEQNEILSGLEKTISQLSDLSQKTFAITPEMGNSLGKARAEMQQSIEAMQNQNSNNATRSQSGAMKYLNEAAAMMKGKMDQMMNGGQGGGMMSMMQQMQQLSQKQMNLNKLTQQLNKGKLTQKQQAELHRLAEEQRLIKKSLDQLNKENKESGQSKKLTSNLDKILNDMEEVITKMKTENVNNELVMSQEKILSKLLDAQRSINQRDFEEKRESGSGKDFERKSPDEIHLGEERKNKIREELIKVIKEGYSQDYEELIRKYFDAIEKEEISIFE